MIRKITNILLATVFLVLSGCGGGGSTSTASAGRVHLQLSTNSISLSASAYEVNTNSLRLGLILSEQVASLEFNAPNLDPNSLIVNVSDSGDYADIYARASSFAPGLHTYSIEIIARDENDTELERTIVQLNIIIGAFQSGARFSLDSDSITINRNQFNSPIEANGVYITRLPNFSDVSTFELVYLSPASWLEANMSPYDRISLSTIWYGSNQASSTVQIAVIARATNGRELSRQILTVNLIVTPS